MNVVPPAQNWEQHWAQKVSAEPTHPCVWTRLRKLQAWNQQDYATKYGEPMAQLNQFYNNLSVRLESLELARGIYAERALFWFESPL